MADRTRMPSAAASPFHVVLILVGCLTFCFAIISAALALPGIVKTGFDGTALLAMAGYLVLVCAGLGLMLLAKWLMARKRRN